jgi:hypothetical protein
MSGEPALAAASNPCMTMFIPTRVLLVLTACAALGGCAAVAPWERGNLARPQMDEDPHPAQREVAEHVYRSREASAGGMHAKGGGCGCY